ncbi:TRAP transporter large permease [Microbacterium sp. No. 7]|uniref:TRAP transporter large permease n=1 Tax=Microbacterium sp. No. 7 TaxID=1714373 RepID=UPI001E56BCA2|nr:TRAP transporter large permease [Microbacterium sp. No. 7]
MLLAVLVVLIMLRVPVAFAILVAGLVGLIAQFSAEGVVGVMEVIPLGSVQSLSLTAIPLFILMAHFMLLSGMMDALFTTARTWFGRLPGGTGVASIAAGVGFSSVSGSSTAAAATLAQTTTKQMIREGYRPETASGIVASVGTLAGMIPPSVILVFYAITAEANVGDMIIAGLVPGIIIAAALLFTMYLPAILRRVTLPSGEATDWSSKLKSLANALPIFAIFIVVIGLIFLGIATPTESAAVGALAAFVYAALRGKATLYGIWHSLLDTVKSTGMIFAIVIAAHVFGYAFAKTGSTAELVAWVGGLDVPPLVIMLILLVLYIVLGFFMDQLAIIALTVPIVLPLVVLLGYDAVWFGVFIVLMGEIGLITPPLGLNIFVVARSARRDTVEVFRGAAPYAIAMAIVAVVFILWPEIVLWLPNAM